MPIISKFYGITVYMYFDVSEHNPPHVHAYYGEYAAAFSIHDGQILSGNFPTKGKRLVKDFIDKYRDELQSMWDSNDIYTLYPNE